MATGYLENNEPFIDLVVRGMATAPSPTKVLIDTGFTGFLSIPLIGALPLGLVLASPTSVVLADGSAVFRLLCVAWAELDGHTKPGMVILEPTGSHAMLGIDFLRKFNARLTIDPSAGRVELVSADPLSGSIPQPN
jgi:predicted aspartyl protease